MSPTARTLAVLKSWGHPLVQVVERWNAFAKIRQDLFHFVDVLSVTSEGQTCAYQVTSGSNVSARRKKITVEHAETLRLLKQAGWVISIHGWEKKPKEKGSKQKVWTLREIEL